MIVANLPGADLIVKGLADLAAGRETPESLLVCIGGPRLRTLGLDVPITAPDAEDPELRLYRMLAAQHGTAAHSRFNALIRRLVSFERAAACAK